MPWIVDRRKCSLCIEPSVNGSEFREQPTRLLYSTGDVSAEMGEGSETGRQIVTAIWGRGTRIRNPWEYLSFLLGWYLLSRVLHDVTLIPRWQWSTSRWNTTGVTWANQMKPWVYWTLKEGDPALTGVVWGHKWNRWRIEWREHPGLDSTSDKHVCSSSASLAYSRLLESSSDAKWISKSIKLNNLFINRTNLTLFY